jgi:alkylhydroperoxidase family enzyme
MGIVNEKLLAIPEYATSVMFDDRERLALEYADRITITDQDVDDEFFSGLQQVFSDDELVELTATIAWENSSSKFNRALRIESQELWQCTKEQPEKD